MNASARGSPPRIAFLGVVGFGLGALLLAAFMAPDAHLHGSRIANLLVAGGVGVASAIRTIVRSVRGVVSSSRLALLGPMAGIGFGAVIYASGPSAQVPFLAAAGAAFVVLGIAGLIRGSLK